MYLLELILLGAYGFPLIHDHSLLIAVKLMGNIFQFLLFLNNYIF